MYRSARLMGRATVFFLLGLIAWRKDGEASGFYLTQQTATGIGRGSAGSAAAAGDASTAYSNPAGLTLLPGAQVMLGASYISPHIDFENQGSTAATPGTLGASIPYAGGGAGNPFESAVLPNFYLAVPIPGDRVWFALAVTSPFGLSTHFPKGWFGRYDATRSELTTVDIAPTIAIKLHEYLSIGGGVDIQYADAMLASAIPNPLTPGGPTAATDGRNRLEGDDINVGFNVGLMITPWPETRFGIHYRSGITHQLDGRYQVSGLTGGLAPFNRSFRAKADLDLPDIVSVAAAHQWDPDLTLLAEYQWFNWSRFSKISGEVAANQPDVVIPQQYQDSHAASIGAEYALSPALSLRGGFRYETTPTRNKFRTTTVPEGDNYSLGLGASYAVKAGLWLDVGAFGTIFEDSRVNLTRSFFAGSPAASSVDIRARTESYSGTLSAGLRWQF